MNQSSDKIPVESSSTPLPAPASAVAPAETAGEQPRILFNPPIDIYETPDGLVLYADLPGVTPENLDLQVQDNRLTLFGRVAAPEPVLQILHQEFQVGDFLRSFILSD
ncbi:MAG: Hsp20/alpha crystallin family protein, partial [Planctomycetaceae bacterium]|nr:Hsp20/alpha crystallin family protein [Planctomycetaceae bacterium]